MTEADLIAALRNCYAPPPARRNIVEAGLVHAAGLAIDTDAPGHGIPGVDPRYTAGIVLQASGDDDADAQLVAQVENRLLGLQPVSRVQVTLRPALFRIL